MVHICHWDFIITCGMKYKLYLILNTTILCRAMRETVKAKHYCLHVSVYNSSRRRRATVNISFLEVVECHMPHYLATSYLQRAVD